jgi:hypothetical protein
VEMVQGNHAIIIEANLASQFLEDIFHPCLDFVPTLPTLPPQLEIVSGSNHDGRN